MVTVDLLKVAVLVSACCFAAAERKSYEGYGKETFRLSWFLFKTTILYLNFSVWHSASKWFKNNQTAEPVSSKRSQMYYNCIQRAPTLLSSVFPKSKKHLLQISRMDCLRKDQRSDGLPTWFGPTWGGGQLRKICFHPSKVICHDLSRFLFCVCIFIACFYFQIDATVFKMADAPIRMMIAPEKVHKYKAFFKARGIKVVVQDSNIQRLGWEKKHTVGENVGKLRMSDKRNKTQPKTSLMKKPLDPLKGMQQRKGWGTESGIRFALKILRFVECRSLEDTYKRIDARLDYDPNDYNSYADVSSFVSDPFKTKTDGFITKNLQRKRSGMAHV